MSKVRINDLARELEVKSRAILDTLPIVGVTEKKTHSSSLEEHEAEKVRVYIRSSEGSSSASKSSSRPFRGEEEIKTKIDLSNISRPGDVLRAITQKKEAAAPPLVARPAAPPVAHAPAHHPAVVGPPAGVSRPVVAPPVTRPVVAPPASAGPVVPVHIPANAPAHISSQSPAQSSSQSGVAPPTATWPVSAPPVRPIAPPSAVQSPAATITPVISVSAPPSAPIATRPVAPMPPLPRMIVPQTGPRPVYKAPIRPTPPPVQPGVQIGASSRPLPGRPVPGQPIFQRRPPVAG